MELKFGFGKIRGRKPWNNSSGFWRQHHSRVAWYWTNRGAESPQEPAHSVVSMVDTTHLGNRVFVFLLAAKCLVLDFYVYKYWSGSPFLPSPRSIESKDISPSTICWLLPFCSSPSPSAWARSRAAPRFPLRTLALGKENSRCWGKNNTLSGRKNTLAKKKARINFPASQTFSWIASGCQNSSKQQQ